MGINFTDLIEKTVTDLFGEGGAKFGKIYRMYCHPINFAIVSVIGVAFYFLLEPLFSGLFGGLFGTFLALIVAFLWNYTMTVGSFGSWWGFGYIQTVPPKTETKSSDTWHCCKRKATIADFREVKGEKEVVNTPAGKLEVSGKDFFIMRGVNGEEYPIRKDIFNKTYELE